MSGFLAALLAIAVTSSDAPEISQAKTRGLTFQADEYAQTYSQRCKTPTSICFLDEEQEVGTRCRCGETLGTVSE